MRRGGSFFGLCPKNEPPLLTRASEASYGLSNYFFCKILRGGNLRLFMVNYRKFEVIY
ncbi:MAG: hypothetical protein U5L45_23010 [Saprospiraceae bacterium]|nr:hypothetical protein [Saprospiraceae bacterium]